MARPLRTPPRLVIDGQDLRYGSENGVGSTVTVSSPAGDPSWLRIPTA